MLRKITFRPWGWWQALFQGPGYLAKIINVKKGQQLSLQYHKHSLPYVLFSIPYGHSNPYVIII